jgi:hypothetical protein
MAIHSRPTLDPSLYPADIEFAADGSAVAWSAVWAGTVVAIGVTLIMLTLGSGFGLSAASPWPGVGASPTEFTVVAGIWLIVMQWISSLFGGYVAGRMRTRWTSLHTDELFFRDTAHGLLTWATATIIVAGVAMLGTTLTGAAVAPADPHVSRETVDAAREAAAKFAMFTGIAMVVGAFIASVAAVIGGRLRDKHP